MNKKEKDRILEEIVLYEEKWFDYRRHAPELCTMLFMREYVKAMERYNERLGNSKHVFVLKSFPSVELKHLVENSQFKQLASLRRFADKNGMPYDIFWSNAAEAHLQLGFKKNFITVYANESIKKHVIASWCDFFIKIFVKSNDPFFIASNFKNHRSQIEYYNYLIRRVETLSAKSRRAEIYSQLVKNGEIEVNFLKSALYRVNNDSSINSSDNRRCF